ncbi:pantoate--beta-alanine ligase [Sphingomonas sp. Leaf407]|uniref:pantoate--beta-alanine ligase n=1 Tax=unclassified Sphingomonas TaxID=196159 RepID=UPI0006F52B15|nr:MULTISPECIES: pantoate--beta-alanine ligase [unclassified Sphingomonas]KQN36496.1 pantoate--beta-alanine ligase [Sphingomonas sp. Leaf42]KQT27117.1 pantoate--beta-alanine ligase [Sphingomonas sp. Leaf407]
MQIIRRLEALRQALDLYAHAGEGVALVPTMGALHAGHMALVDAARRRAPRTVVSIFVNPKQFGPGEDLARYPRREAADAQMLADHGVDILWAPEVDEMYPAGFATTVSVSGVSEVLDGAHRLGHFDGVATVVARLFGQVRPVAAFFGEKDFQQLAVVRRMVADLSLPVEIVGVPTQREDDGLALSSRNIYLDEAERTRAVALPRALGVAERALSRGDDPASAVAGALAALTRAGFDPDYVALVDAETLRDPVRGRPARLLAAARLGTTRLIDNIAVDFD